MNHWEKNFFYWPVPFCYEKAPFLIQEKNHRPYSQWYPSFLCEREKYKALINWSIERYLRVRRWNAVFNRFSYKTVDIIKGSQSLRFRDCKKTCGRREIPADWRLEKENSANKLDKVLKNKEKLSRKERVRERARKRDRVREREKETEKEKREIERKEERERKKES